MSESRFKVTDKRMFTADGQLREEFRFLEEEKAATAEKPAAAASAAPSPESAEASVPASGGSPDGGGHSPPSAGAGPVAQEAPAAPPPEPQDVEEDEGDGPAFLDLLAMMAEPASIYLQRAQAARGQDPESLQLAGLHIDLLDVLRRKTRGNLSAQESSALESALYQLRNAYIQIRGI